MIISDGETITKRSKCGVRRRSLVNTVVTVALTSIVTRTIDGFSATSLRLTRPTGKLGGETEHCCHSDHHRQWQQQLRYNEQHHTRLSITLESRQEEARLRCDSSLVTSASSLSSVSSLSSSTRPPIHDGIRSVKVPPQMFLSSPSGQLHLSEQLHAQDLYVKLNPAVENSLGRQGQPKGIESDRRIRRRTRHKGVLGFVVNDDLDSSIAADSSRLAPLSSRLAPSSKPSNTQLNGYSSSSSPSPSSSSSFFGQDESKQRQHDIRNKQRGPPIINNIDSLRWKNGNDGFTLHKSNRYSNNLSPRLNRSPIFSTKSDFLSTVNSGESISESKELQSLLWLPWIPSKAQIKTMKVEELKNACLERGLSKTGKKIELQDRLLDWSQNQWKQGRQGKGGVLDQLKEEKARRKTIGSLDENRDGTNAKKLPSSNSSPSVSSSSPQLKANSLAEWARTVNLEPLFQRRKKIHKDKREGRHSHKYKEKMSVPEKPTKEYMLELAKLFEAPSSPYSNYQVKQMYGAAKIADQSGDREVSKEILHRLKEITPQDARIFRRLARMEMEEGKIGKARAILQEGLRSHPDNAYLWQGLGQLEMKQAVLEGVSDAMGGLFSFSSSSLDINDDDRSSVKARKCFLKAIQLDPSFPNPYHALGTLEHTLGNIANAMKTLKRGVEYCPTNHRIHHALGDLYREAKMLDMAERSYKRGLDHVPPVSSCFAYSALANVAYEQGDIEKSRRYLKRSVSTNYGRHAQGWVAWAQLEESEGDFSKARSICADALGQYERGLIERSLRHRKNFRETTDRNTTSFQESSLLPPSEAGLAGREEASIEESVLSFLSSLDDDPVILKNRLLRSVPVYRSGDRFLKVYLNWIRLEVQYGDKESVNEVFTRASIAFPKNWKISLQWAQYHVRMNNHDRARELFTEACEKADTKHTDPYLSYAEFEVSLGNYQEARDILYRGALGISLSPDGDGGLGGSHNGLTELFFTWAVCEWYLNNPPRAEVLFDHALRLAKSGEEGSAVRSHILYAIARLEHYREEYHLAQHCIGLCLKENSSTSSSSSKVMQGGGNKLKGVKSSKVFEFWAEVANDMGNESLSNQCITEAEEARKKETKEENQSDFSALLSTSSLRRDPWYFKLFESKNEENTFSRCFCIEDFEFPNTLKTWRTQA